jgi:hypothetical protein
MMDKETQVAYNKLFSDEFKKIVDELKATFNTKRVRLSSIKFRPSEQNVLRLRRSDKKSYLDLKKEGLVLHPTYVNIFSPVIGKEKIFNAVYTDMDELLHLYSHGTEGDMTDVFDEYNFLDISYANEPEKGWKDLKDLCKRQNIRLNPRKVA